ncbi:MAG: peptide ABC transporter substrate-binding protein [Planctomycetia bacterium]|nr:peptide ABC transporter substrate-binding protein [Planctomycetia bacterium]
MEQHISEADWKLFRQLRAVALERFCQRVLLEVGQLASGSGASSHERYLEVYRLIHERDEELASAFNDPRRSTARFQLARMRALGLLTDAEYSEFSAETRNAVEVVLGG